MSEAIKMGTRIQQIHFHPGHLRLSDDKGGFLVRISLRDGTLEYGPNYSPDVAADAFWRAVAGKAPGVPL